MISPNTGRLPPKRPSRVSLDSRGHSRKWKTMASEQRRGAHIDYMVVFPNPDLTTEKEEEKFLRLTPARNVMSSVAMILRKVILEGGVFDIDLLMRAQSLKELRQLFLLEYLRFLEGSCVGAEWEMFWSIDRDEIFVQHYLLEDSAKYHAETQKHMLQLDSSVVDVLNIGQNKAVVSPAWIPYVQAKEELYTSTYRHHDLFRKCNDTFYHGSIFRGRDTIQLLRRVIDMYTDVRNQENFGLILGHYACHERLSILKFKDSWASLRKVYSIEQPLHMVRDYFGSEVAFYFCWIEFLTKMLCWLVLPGIILEVCAVFFSQVDRDSNCMFLYCVVIALWSSVFSDLWQQTELRYSTYWGVEGVVEGCLRLTPAGVSGMRPNYTGELVESKIDSNIKIKDQPLHKKLLRRLLTKSVTTLFIFLVVVCVTGIFLARHIMAQSHTYFVRVHAERIGSFVNACQIKVFDYIWGWMAVKLCEWENYRTDHQWKQALIWKMFLFKFVNTFNSIFYIAFVQRYVDGCPEGNCIPLLRIQILMVFGVNTMLGVMEMIQPWILHRWNRHQEDSQLSEEQRKEPRSYVEDQNKMESYTELDHINDYMVIMLQFGFVVMFSSVVPIVAFVAVVSNLIQIRADAWKLCNAMKRPFPRVADGIGMWRDVQSILSWLGVFTNIGICIFSLPQFNTYTIHAKLLLFFAAEHAMIILKLMLHYYIPAVPHDVMLERKRREHVLDTLHSSQGLRIPEGVLGREQHNFPRDSQLFKEQFLEHLDCLRPGDWNFEPCLDQPKPQYKEKSYAKRLTAADADVYHLLGEHRRVPNGNS